MRLSIERNDLLRLLTSTTKVVEARNTIPILSTVRLVADGNKLTATATDLDIEITASTPVMAEAGGGVCVEARLLENIVKKLPASANVLLSVEDKNLVVKAGRSRFVLQFLPVSDFPDMSAGKFASEFKTNLAALLAPVKFAMSNEETRYYLCGVFLHVNGGQLVAVATDGHRLSINKTESVGDIPPVILPSKFIGLVPDGQVDVSLSDTKVRITTADAVITSKLIDGTYPDYQRVVPTSIERVVAVDGQALAAAADRASVVSDMRTPTAKLSVSTNSIEVFVRGDNTAEDTVEAEYDGEPFSVGYNARYMAEALAALPAGYVRFAMDPTGPALIKSDAAPDQLVVLMPQRV
jgi:DNA polymerase-3 subunit beta